MVAPIVKRLGTGRTSDVKSLPPPAGLLPVEPALGPLPAGSPQPSGQRPPRTPAAGSGQPVREKPARGIGRRRPMPRAGGRIRRRLAGFTLVELAIVVAVVGFLLGAFLVPLRAQIEATRVRETERTLGEIRDALIGYAMTRGALPCPDVVSDGIDGAAPATCTGTALAGVLPFQTLGVPRADAWGRYFEYRVTREFTTPAVTGQPPAAGRLDLTDAGDVMVLTRGDDPGTGTTIEIKHQSAATALTRTAPAVVRSAGPNGLGGLGVTTGTALPAPSATSIDEIENTDADATFVSRPHSRGAETCDDADETTVPPPPMCEFDDIVTWLSTPALMAGLVDARVLP